jgi:hypothetical protein
MGAFVAKLGRQQHHIVLGERSTGGGHCAEDFRKVFQAA